MASPVQGPGQGIASQNMASQSMASPGPGPGQGMASPVQGPGQGIASQNMASQSMASPGPGPGQGMASPVQGPGQGIASQNMASQSMASPGPGPGQGMASHLPLQDERGESGLGEQLEYLTKNELFAEMSNPKMEEEELVDYMWSNFTQRIERFRKLSREDFEIHVNGFLGWRRRLYGNDRRNVEMGERSKNGTPLVFYHKFADPEQKTEKENWQEFWRTRNSRLAGLTDIRRVRLTNGYY